MARPPSHEPLAGADDTTSDVVARPPSVRARWARRAGYAVLVLLLLAAATNLLGPRRGDVDASGGGYELAVQYPSVTRPGQPAPLRIDVTATDGFGDVVQVRVCQEFFDDHDFQNWFPNPSAETNTGGWVVYEFDPPPSGDTLRISLDARTAPGVVGELDDCGVEVLEDDQPVVAVTFTVWRLL